MPDELELVDWLEAQLRQHYAALRRLALAVLGDERLAEAAARQAFARAAANAGQYRGRSDSLWLYELGWKAMRGQPTRPVAGPAQPAQETALLRWADGLPAEERLLLALRYLLDWPPEQAARLLHAGQGAVQAQLGVFRREMRRSLAFSDPADDALERQVASLLQAHWPVVALDDAEVHALAQELAGQTQAAATAAGTPAGQPAATRRWFLVAALGLGAVVCLLAATAGLLAWQLAPQAAPTAGVLLPGMPTPVTPAPRLQPLTARSSADEIQQRVQKSASAWHTLWIDVQTYDYGPASYRGAPRVYRAQAWVSQPEQSLEFTGLLSRRPSRSALVLDGRKFVTNAVLGEAQAAEWNGPVETLVDAERLRAMVFPAAVWGQQGRLEPTGLAEEVVGRPAVIVDWIDESGTRPARLWLDAATGLALRWQEFDPAYPDLLTVESIAVGVKYDENHPPGQLLNGLELDVSPLAPPQPGGQTLPPAPNFALPIAERQRLPAEAPPPGFDPALARLDFQFSPELQAAGAVSQTAQAPYELFADGYRLGSGRFGLPWMLRCTRSPDGQRLAFNTFSDGTALPDGELRWFNLSEPQRVYQPLPGLAVVDFAFAPGSRQLAAFGRAAAQPASANAETDGLYLVELGTGERRLLLPLAAGESLVWSPDGEYLALVGALPDDQQTSRLLLVHMRTGQIAYNEPFDPQTDLPPEAWPGRDWPVSFPRPMGGMDACAAAPQP